MAESDKLVFPIEFKVEETLSPSSDFQKNKPRQAKSKTNAAPFQRENIVKKLQEEQQKLAAESKQQKQELTQLKQKEQELQKALNEEKKQLAKIKSDTLKQNKEIQDTFAKFDTKRLGVLDNFSGNPSSFIGSNITDLLSKGGPHGLALSLAITAIVAAPESIKKIIETLSQKGGPLNRDWTRIIEEEVNGIFSQEDQKRRFLGLDGFISTTVDTFNDDSGATVFNSFIHRDEIRLTKIGQDAKAKGIQ